MTSLKKQLTELMSDKPNTRLSLYMPSYRAGREQRQNQIRFKNLLADAEELLTHEPDPEAAGNTLEALRQVLADDGHAVWRHPGDGLALFASGSDVRFFQLPMEVGEQVHVGERYYFKPLLPLLQADGRYFAIAVSQNRVRLFEGTRDAFRELHPASLPKDLEDALNVDEYVSSLQYFSYQSAAASEAVYHGHGIGEDDANKQLLQYFHRLNDSLGEFFSGHSEPLVFAGVQRLFPLFKQAVHYAQLLDVAAEGNFDEASTEQIHEAVWKVVEPRFAQKVADAVASFNDAYGQKEACDQLADLLIAAERGAVDTLLIRRDASCWGQLAEDGTVVIDEQPTETSLDLLDEAAYETMRHGGELFVVDENDFPAGDAPAVAVLRFPLDAAVAR